MRERLLLMFRQGRPVLRVQLTLLYSGLVLGLLAAVLFASNVLYRHTEVRAGSGAPAAPASSGHSFDVGPALIGLIAAVIALAAAWWLAGRFLRPIRAMTTAAQEISATNLNRRLGVRGPDDELTELGRTLDDLFGRLEASFESQRHFVANASHELRTPLAGQRTLLQVALADPQADTRTLRSTCDEVLRLGARQERLIDSLLTLATSERGIERRESFDLGALAESIVLTRRQDAERRGIDIHTALAETATTGDRNLVESLVSNLLDNALAHNRVGGHVNISTRTSAGRSLLSVSNTGAVIPAEELERLFQPFQRLGAERVHTTDGHGLGLAIVRSIATAHGATIDARSGLEGGLEIDVSFPASAQQTAA